MLASAKYQEATPAAQNELSNDNAVSRECTRLLRQYIEEDAELHDAILRAADYAARIVRPACVRGCIAVLIKHHFENSMPIIGLSGDLAQAALAGVDWVAVAEAFVCPKTIMLDHIPTNDQPLLDS